MPPRHAYWTIIFGNQPTSFRSATRDELLPTFKQIQSRHPDAVMMWFARGRLWRSEEEAREALFRRREARRPRGEFRGPRPDVRGPRSEVRGPRSDVRGPRPENRGPRADARAPRSEDRKTPQSSRGRGWRPGGDHKDPRDRFKVPRDVKRARFKQKLRRDRLNPKPPKKKDDE